MRLYAFLILLGGLLAAPAVAETIAIVDARILTAGPAGTIENGTILVRNGLVVAVGPDVRPPPGARIVEGRGGVATPGFIHADSTLGAVEVSQVPASADRSNQAAGLSAAFDISLGLNPDSILLPVARLGGITRAVVTPQQGGRPVGEIAFAGQAAVIDLGQRPDMVTRPRVAMILEMGEAGAERSGGARGGAIVQLRALLDDARHFARNRALYERGAGRAMRLSRLDLEALVPVVLGRMPLIVKVDRASDIIEMIALAREEGLHLILDGAEEGWRVAGDISREGVPVILDPVANLPGSFARLGATMENAARLHAAGVTLVLRAGSGVAHRARELRYGAGNAVAHGLPHDAALAALTINPARVFSVAERVGSIEVGKEADIVLWSGDPFEPLSQPRAILVRGIEQPLTSRQLHLRDRYLPQAR
jgi:imidazolonepropionase-like amidohydrolase